MSRRKTSCLNHTFDSVPITKFNQGLTDNQVNQAWQIMGPTVHYNLSRVTLDILLAVVWWEAVSMTLDVQHQL